MVMSAKWDIPIPIIIEIISWLDQESLMNLSVVSKQLHNITICNDSGNENKIIPVFEVSGSSTQTFFQNLSEHFLNKKIKNKLQCYRRMMFKDANNFEVIVGVENANRLTQNIIMSGITLLDLVSSSPMDLYNNCNFAFPITFMLPNIFPNLSQVNFHKTGVNDTILENFSKRCPLLEKVTSHNNSIDAGINLNGYTMGMSNNLKEININNSYFWCYYVDRDKFADLYNHQELFMFHHCCKSLERVSIRNMKYRMSFGTMDDDQKLIFTQNVLIKFVRNSPPTLRWFRSDLTLDNMTMLRLERPGIELLN
jgi:hypothetical protein